MLEDLKELSRILDKFIAKYEKKEADLYSYSDTQDDERLKQVGKQLLKLKGNEGVDESEVQERWNRFDKWDGNDIY